MFSSESIGSFTEIPLSEEDQEERRMCWIRGLGDPNILVCCGITAHARKVIYVMNTIFISLFAFGATSLYCKNYPFNQMPIEVLFWVLCGGVVLLVINMLGVLCSSKSVLFPGFVVYGAMVVVMTAVTVELSLAVLFPSWEAPSPIIKYYLSLHRMDLAENWLMRLIVGLITLNFFFLIQVPTTGFIAQMKVWKDIGISRMAFYLPPLKIVQASAPENIYIAN